MRVSALLIAVAAYTANALKPTTARRSLLTGGAAAAAAVVLPQAAGARGRATQGAAMQRYSPRIAAFGAYLAGDLEKTIDGGDWSTLAAECVTVEDKKKKIKLGTLPRGESAMDLWANTYSDNTKSDKTKEMLAEVERISAARATLADVACRGTGACAKGEGGLFGFGAKKAAPASPQQLASEAAQATADAKAAFNRYVGLNNDRVPVSMDIGPLKAI